MANNIYFSSDLHLGHANILTFISEEPGMGQVRPGFSSVEEMDELIIKRHNETVGPLDKWYCMGDIGFGMKELGPKLARMNGKKRLILGNHDYSTKKDFAVYFEHFEKVMESRRMGQVLFTHRPVHLGPDENRIKANVHGHIHEKNLPDQRYLNLSVEQTDYYPVSMDYILTVYRDRGINVTME